MGCPSGLQCDLRRNGQADSFLAPQEARPELDLAISEAKLFYVAADHLMAVPVNSGAAFEAGVPKPPFTVPPMYKGWYSCEVAADGQRFLVTTSADGEKRWPLTVVLN